MRRCSMTRAKYVGRWLSIIVTVMVILTTMSAQSEPTAATSVKWQRGEKNYIVALQSENPGVRQSAAFHVGEYKLRGAVQPLVTLLKNDSVDEVRMAAAFALIQLDDEQGRQAVVEASLRDGSDQVAQFCKTLLNVTSSRDSAMR